MTSAQKRKIKKARLMIVLYVLAVIGTYTVGANVFSAGRSAYKHTVSFFHSLEWKTPMLVEK